MLASIPTKDQYFYIDNAFESATGNVTVEYIAPTTALPSGISWAENSDSQDTDQGEARFYGTPSSGTEGTYTMKVKVDYLMVAQMNKPNLPMSRSCTCWYYACFPIRSSR